MLTDLIIARSALDLDKPNLEEYANFNCRISRAARWLAVNLGLTKS